MAGRVGLRRAGVEQDEAGVAVVGERGRDVGDVGLDGQAAGEVAEGGGRLGGLDGGHWIRHAGQSAGVPGLAPVTETTSTDTIATCAHIASPASPSTGLAPFELGVAAEVFALPRPELDVAWWYEFALCAERPGPLGVVGGFAVVAPHGLEALERADTVIVPGVPDPHEDPPEPVLDALRAAHARGARMLSICSGAFALAAAGLLDGIEAATHWRYAALLQERFPAVRVNADVLYLDAGRVLTSAGTAAGIDLCLHLVRADHGAEVANRVARRMVVAAHRDGGQAQFIERPVPRAEPATRSAARSSTRWPTSVSRSPSPTSRAARTSPRASSSGASAPPPAPARAAG